jgi:hypothetical protein
VIIGHANARQLIDTPARHSPPRLIIIDEFDRGQELRAEELPAGTSVVGLPFPAQFQGGRMISGIVSGIVHDMPLHEVLKTAGRDSNLDLSTRQHIRLLTSVEGLENLRLSPLVEQAQGRLREFVRFRNVEGMASSMRTLGLEPHVAESDLSNVSRALHLSSIVESDLAASNLTLGPIAESIASLDASDETIRSLDEAGEQISSNPELLNRVEHSQQRRVSIWVSNGGGSIEGLDSEQGLLHDLEYDLNVGVGIDWANDLVSPEAPALDPILPPTNEDTYPISFAVFSSSATFPAGSSQDLRVGRIGASGPISFTFRTPRRGSRTQIRILCLYRRHLLQAFSFEARLIDAPDQLFRGPGMKVQMNFSRIDNLTQIDSVFTERMLAVATNSSGGTRHRLMFDTGDGIPFDERSLGEIQTLTRARLAHAFGQQRNENLSSTDIRTFVTQMAVQGRALWDQCFTYASEALKDVLISIASKQDPVTIQHLRIQPSFAFPWPIVYDWSLPYSSADRNRASICLGIVNGSQCACGPDSTGVICARGFWGIRHVIEEFLEDDQINAPIDTIAHMPSAPSVLCTLGVVDDSSLALAKQLKQRLGEDFLRLQPSKSLYESLRNEGTRPAVLTVIGHLSNKPSDTEPDAPRISVEGSERYMHPKALVDERKKGKWVTPYRPVILLLACESGADRLGDITSSFVARLASLGASAVIACEERIDTGLAAYFAEWAIARLGTSGPGESLRTWRAQLLAESNPCGFLFSCFGNAHVTDGSFPN